MPTLREKCLPSRKRKSRGGRIRTGDKGGGKDRKRRLTRRSRRHDAGCNNSMPMADKAYDAPEPPEDIEAFNLPGLAEEALQFRQAFRPVLCDFVTMYFRVRRQNYEQLLWQYISSGVFDKEKIYSARSLPYWTISMRMRVRISYPLGQVLETMKCRLGITNPGLKFCLDGFFGMTNYTDIFGNSSDSCPWMELSNFSTVKSLRLRDGDSIFISIATAAQIENVLKWRKRQSETTMPPQVSGESQASTLLRRKSSRNL